ncbi:MAG TPA: alpha-glucan family phosphorylase, partial [Candidatus Woesearchaeota archaeon]|nr:alpha-glucan family phosphorylase [Candidatus Woesearchaeota archaeon]
IAEQVGRIQLVFAGKAHIRDTQGKEAIRKIFEIKSHLSDKIKLVFLEDYDIELAKKIIPGVDVWLNTPRRPLEASGTSGMKACHNGVPSFSTLDGWWIEGHIEGFTGWAIGDLNPEQSDSDELKDMYYKLEKVIMPMYYNKRDDFIKIMRNCIAFNASFFNTHRMVSQYVLSAYLN